ncbi:zeta toxin family protein [Candidatus Wolfebacteria bacterium]|nr:zeta toxin family protein [Candidatus Wolfebacteria bacterium]
MTDEEIRAQAIEFAKQNKVRIAKELTDLVRYASDITPVSVFMAGSPGAGKTEFSKNLIKILEGDEERRVVRIDGDEVRPLIPEYTGNNSRLFQGAISLIVEKIHDLVLHNKQNFVLDSTFSNYTKAADNVRRSLEKNRVVFIFYIYQKPEVAWKFTQAREETEGRNIPKSAFIEQFFGAREVINQISGELGDKVVIFLIKKNFEKNTVEDIIKIDLKGGKVDDYIAERYTKDELEKCL